MREIDFTTEYDLREYAPTGDEWLLCYADGTILAHHGAGATTGTGRTDATMVVGSERDIAAEIARLGLVSSEEEPPEDEEP
jgi:hypothetical protein